MKAGGLTSDAYVEGARIIRRLSDNEQRLRNSTYKILAERGSLDSVSMELLEMSASYNVGIDLELALTYPGSDYDMVLQESDQLVIPKYSNTVTIDGAVLYPNTVLYVDGQGIKYYINQSGGFAKGARRKKIFVVHLNGTVSRYRGSKDIRPGSEIIIPSRDMASRMTMAEIMAIAQTATSIGLMSTSIANMVK